MVSVEERASWSAGPATAPATERSSDGPVRRPVRSGQTRAANGALWIFRALLLTPFVLMGPEIVSAVLGRPGAVANISTSTADVLGTSTFLLFAMMLTVTPIQTLTGWTWHLPLRRDYGVAMFVTAALDLTLAALTTGNEFSGGVLGRIGGRSFLLAGTLSVLLLVPLALTANRRAQRMLGGYWKRLHRLVFVIWVLIMIHLFLLFDFSGAFVSALALSAPLALMRVPALRRWWTSARRTHQHRIVRGALALVLCTMFAFGFVPLARELVAKGHDAFVEQPVDD